MNVLILYPPFARPNYLGRFSLTEPLTGIFLAPVLREHRLRFVDMRLQPDLEARLRGFAPDVVVLCAWHLVHGALDGVIRRLRAVAPDARLLLVGAAEYGATHVSERPLDYAHPELDVIVPTFYLNAVQRRVAAVLDAWTAGREPDDVPGLWLNREGWEQTAFEEARAGHIGVPDRTILGGLRGRYRIAGIGRAAYVMYTDGCPHRCRYCSMSKTDGTMFVRHVPDVLAELEALSEPRVFLADFEPLQAPDALLALADSIEAAGIRKEYYLLTRADSVVNRTHVLERWRQVGLRWVFLGLDGHDAARLRTVHKGSSVAVHHAALRELERLGLGAAVGMTVSPDAGLDDFADLARAARELDAPMIDFTVETPLVGTTLFDEMEHRLTTRDWSLFDLQHAVLPTRLPLERFYREMLRLHMLAWRKSSRGVLKHQPLRDMLRNACSAPGAFRELARAARDHRAPVGAPDGRAVAA